MPSIVSTLDGARAVMNAARAVVLVYVEWSPFPRQSQKVLIELEASAEDWCSEPVAFFVLRPEDDEQINAWYEALMSKHPDMELHGHGYGPFWWIRDRAIVDCMRNPYRLSLEELKSRSGALLCVDEQ